MVELLALLPLNQEILSLKPAGGGIHDVWCFDTMHRASHYLPSTGLGGSVGCASDWRPGGRGFNPC